MSRKSITGPLILVLLGVLFLINNLRPDLSVYTLFATYWPFLLILAGAIGLVEVLFHASRGVAAPPRPLSGGWIFWIVIWCVIAGGLGNRRAFHFSGWDHGGFNFLGTDYQYDVPPAGAPEVVSQGVTRIVLDNIRGDLSVRGDESGDVKITGHKSIRALNRGDADRADQNSRIRVERQGDTLTIHAEGSEASGTLQVTNALDITIPKGLSVEARGRTGDLTIADVDGAVDVSAGRGDVRLSHIGKNVRIESSRSGMVRAEEIKGNFDLQGKGTDIQLQNIGGAVAINGDYSGTLQFEALEKPLRFQSSRTEFHVEAVPGSITLDLGNLKMSNVSGPVSFQTRSRDIDITDVTNALDLAIERGDIRVTASKAPLPRMDVHSHSGDITLSLPAETGFQLKGSTSHGEVENDFGGSLQTQSRGHSSTIQGQTGSGPMITATTDRGTVSIRKL